MAMGISPVVDAIPWYNSSYVEYLAKVTRFIETYKKKEEDHIIVSYYNRVWNIKFYLHHSRSLDKLISYLDMGVK